MFLARRVRTHQLWDGGVDPGGGQPESSATEGRSLDVERPQMPSQPKGGNTTTATTRTIAMGGAARLAEALVMINCRRKTMNGGLCIMSGPPRPFDPARATLPHPAATHYRLAHQVLESTSPGKRGGTQNMGARQTRDRWMEGTVVGWFLDTYSGIRQEREGEMPGKPFQRGGKSATFFCLTV
jgi:hypothetical protein